MPAVCDLEVASLLRRTVAARQLSDSRAEEALTLYLALPIRRHDHRALLPRVWSLRRNFSPYDAAYLALAEELTAALITADGRLAREAARLGLVEVVTPS